MVREWDILQPKLMRLRALTRPRAHLLLLVVAQFRAIVRVPTATFCLCLRLTSLSSRLLTLWSVMAPAPLSRWLVRADPLRLTRVTT